MGTRANNPQIYAPGRKGKNAWKDVIVPFLWFLSKNGMIVLKLVKILKL